VRRAIRLFWVSRNDAHGSWSPGTDQPAVPHRERELSPDYSYPDIPTLTKLQFPTPRALAGTAKTGRSSSSDCEGTILTTAGEATVV